MKKVLFVCLGNICRSPAAEEIARQLTQKLKIDVFVDSAGTSGYHSGYLPDPRMREFAKIRGYNLTSRSRQLTEEDLEKFDYILVMDNKNYTTIKNMKNFSTCKDKILKLATFTTDADIIPDPYYGGDAGFFHVIDLLEEGIKNFFNQYFLN